MVNRNPDDPISFRPNPAEQQDIILFTETKKLYDSVGALLHAALGIGFREMKKERGLLPAEYKNEEVNA